MLIILSTRYAELCSKYTTHLFTEHHVTVQSAANCTRRHQGELFLFMIKCNWVLVHALHNTRDLWLYGSSEGHSNNGQVFYLRTPSITTGTRTRTLLIRNTRASVKCIDRFSKTHPSLFLTSASNKNSKYNYYYNRYKHFF